VIILIAVRQARIQTQIQIHIQTGAPIESKRATVAAKLVIINEFAS